VPKNKKSSIERTPEQILASDLARTRDFEEFCPTPTYFFNKGDRVSIGNLPDAYIEESIDDGKIYLIDYTSIDNNYGNPITYYHRKNYWPWYRIRPFKEDQSEHNFVKNTDIRLHYSQMEIDGLMSRMYSFGVDFDPEYQRDYEWSLDDKVKLIDSVFKNIDIGKFIFIHYEWGEHPKNFSYAILDGKQRLSALADYYLNKFSYRGCFFNDLNRWEQTHFLKHSVASAEVQNIGREQILRMFLMVNTTGKVMKTEDIAKVEQILAKISKNS
jgi:hypothetical protein